VPSLVPSSVPFGVAQTGRYRLLVVSSVRWNYLWQRHHALARAAAKDGWEVDFLQPRPRGLRQLLSYPLRRAAGRTFTGEPPQVPGVRVRPSRDWPVVRGRYDLALVYLPDRLTELLLDRVRPGRVVYDAVLDWAAVPRNWYPPTGWAAAERRIARRPEAIVTTDSTGMRDVLRRRGTGATVVLPAADDEFLQAAVTGYEERLGRTLYFGSVRDEIDVDRLVDLAMAGVPVDVVGRVEDAVLGARLVTAGVQLRPPVSITELPAVVARYKVLLLPYRGARAATLLPAKFWNCLAAGAWVAISGLDLRGVEEPQVVALEQLGTGGVAGLFSTPPPTGATPPTWADRWREIVTAASASASASVEVAA
jgi:hypothetical protein